MIRKLLAFIFIYIIMAILPPNLGINTVYSAETSLKVNSINFDNSDSIIFLGTSGAIEPAEIKIVKSSLTNPDRVFFDIQNAVLTFPNKTFELKNSRLKQLRIAQNSTEPNIVRIVIWNSANYDMSKIKILKIKNNIILKLSNEIPLQQYLTQIYRETKESAVEYNDKAIVIPEEQKPQESDEIFNKVQQAFKEGSQELVRPNIEQKQAKLKSRFFLEKASARNGSLLLSGVGVINVEKPFFLTEPSRVVFDLPNTIVLQELRDKEIKLSDTSTAKIGQFEPSKARIVIKTDKPENYRGIYSTNLQTLLISNSSYISGVSQTQIKSELAYFKEQNVNPITDVINIMFSNPIIFSIKRDGSKINLTLYNLSNFNTESFNQLAIKNKTGFEAKQLGTNMYRISFPVSSATLVDCYETLNASQLRFVFTSPKPAEEDITKTQKVIEQAQNQAKPYTSSKTGQGKQIKEEIPFANLLERQKNKQNVSKRIKKHENVSKKIRNKVIIIDPGHGGNDTGAMRGNLLEKNLTLAIALKVRQCLREKGFTNIIMTRANDKTLTLEDRVNLANDNKADIFVSIHINASVKSEIHGIETHYYTENGYNVAKVMHKELMENVSATDRGLFKSKFYVINHTEAPAVLLELGFISNEQERNALNSENRQMASAQAIADGIAKYLTEH